MRYQLCDQVSFCWVGDRAMFLDVRRDRYFCLGAVAEAVFLALIQAGGQRVEGIEHLIRLGLVEPRGACSPRMRPAVSPSAGRDLNDVTPAPPSALSPLEVCARLAWRRADLRRRPLAELLAGLKRSTPGTDGPRPDADGTIDGLAARFNLTRTKLPLALACLPDSLALRDYLSARGLGCDLVFGVKLHPFAAHCWVQRADLVLNDALDSVTAFTPILTVPCATVS